MSANTSTSQTATLLPTGDVGGGGGDALSGDSGAGEHFSKGLGVIGATQQTPLVPATQDTATAAALKRLSKIKTTTPGASAAPGSDASSQHTSATGNSAAQHATASEGGAGGREQLLENKAAAEVAVSEWVLGPGQSLVDKILEQANQPSTAG